MKQLILSIAMLTSAACLVAQDLPRPSPNATVTQVVGLTDISVTYSRPGVKEREIWGGLVPYGEIWRAGANKATKFETSYEIEIAGKKLPAGAYSLFILPKENSTWTVIFNTETELWGTSDYEESKDQVRLEVKPEDVSFATERLEFHFLDVDMKSAQFVMDWAGKRLSMAISADPAEQAIANIKTALEDAEEDKKWRVYRNAASYASKNDMIKQGLEWIEESVKLQENWYSYWVYADLLALDKDYKGAIAKAEKALEIGEANAKENDEEFGYTDRIQADIDEWKGK